MITAVTTCMGRLEHLQTTLPLMLEEFDRVILMDWSCPQNSGKWAKEQGAEVVCQFGEKYWHASRARNLAAKLCKTQNVCFLDADTLVFPGLANELESLITKEHMVLAPRTAENFDVLNLGGFIALDIERFWQINGYDETIKGFAHEDANLRARLALESGLKVSRPSPGSLAVIRHSDELRGRYLPEPIHVSSASNFQLVRDYLLSKGVSNWVTDPRTADIAYRIPGYVQYIEGETPH